MSIFGLTEKLKWQHVPQRVVARYEDLLPDIQRIWGDDRSLPEKMAELQELTGFEKSAVTIPTSTNPLVTTLVGGLAGAGLGYGAGALGEAVMPNWPNKRRMRLSGALIGALAGMSPGAWQFSDNYLSGQPLMTPRAKGYSAADAKKFDNPLPPASQAMYDIPMLKASAFYPGTGLVGGNFDAEEFNDMVWRDPRVANRMDTPIQAAATGLVSGAASLGGRKTKLVTPMDMGRIAAGMGSGYLSGALVGKALGLLMGMPQQTQDKLKNTGMMAGIISNVVPLVFGK
jgi:hypothetical protein